MGDGLFECILGRWSDLRAGADFDGKDEADAGADYGTFGLLGRSAERTWLGISPLSILPGQGRACRCLALGIR